jgi:hypothetical protein
MILQLLLAASISQHAGYHSQGSQASGLPRDEWLQYGFVDASDITVAFDNATRKFSLTPAVTSFEYYHDGAKYTALAAITATITDTEGSWMFYIDGEGSIATSNNPSLATIIDAIQNDTVAGFVSWDADNNKALLAPSLYGYRMSAHTKFWLYRTHEGIYQSGMALGDLSTDQDGSSDAHAQFSMGVGEFVDADILRSLSAVGSTTGLVVLYIDAGKFRWTTNAGYSVLTTGTGRLAYNNAGAQTEVTSGRFVLAHVFATGMYEATDTEIRYFAWQGQAEYTTLANAEAGATTETEALLDPALRSQKQPRLVLVATVIYQTSDGYSNAVKARIRQTAAGDDFIDWLP